MFNTINRVCILGCCGAGKSTLAKKLQVITKLELIHLDQHYWKPNWVESTKSDWDIVHKQLINKPTWIIDGNYGRTMDSRMDRADTIVYLDFPIWKCLLRVLNRVNTYNGITRPDMTDGCPEGLDFNFLHYVATFNIRNRKKNLSKLNRLKAEKRIFILRNDEEVLHFLNDLRSRIKK